MPRAGLLSGQTELVKLSWITIGLLDGFELGIGALIGCDFRDFFL